MYERSAIVLERYFENLLNYSDNCNLRDNYKNYCKLVEKLEKYQINFQKEAEATQEFRMSLNRIKNIRLVQDKLYKKSVKLEYNRNLLFGNLEGKVDETRKCIEKIEEDVEANNKKMTDNKEELIEALKDYNEKRMTLAKCKRYNKMAANDYNEILKQSKNNFVGITKEIIKKAMAFSNYEEIDDILNVLYKNGKDEKVPFNEGVIQNATNFSVEIAKKEEVIYIYIYDKMKKLLSDIKEGVANVEHYKKYLRNEKAKIDFLMSAKNYVTQFLDYERMTAIYGKKSHNRLMLDACESFNLDIVQINNLYDLLLMEIANKATKKAYKSLYNKSYLADIQEKEEKFKREKNRVNLNTATLINSNFWRIEGVKGIYTTFYKNVIEVFGRELEEFDLPRDFSEDTDDQDDFVGYETILDQEEQAPAVANIPFKINVEDTSSEDNSEDGSDDNEYYGYNEIIDNVVDELQEGNQDEEFDIFGEKYKDIDFRDNMILNEEISNKKAEIEFSEENDGNDLFETDTEDEGKEVFDLKLDMENHEEESVIDKFEEEETLFSEIKPVRRKKGNKIEDVQATSGSVKPSSLIKKLKKTTSKRKKSEEGIW